MRQPVILEVRSDGLVVGGGAEAVPVVLPVSSESVDEWAATVDGAFKAAGLPDCREVHVRLYAPYVQVRTLRDLPAVGRRDLEALVAHQQERFFRPIRGKAVISAAWIGSGEERIACAALAPLEVLESLEAGLEATGHRMSRLVPALGASVEGPELRTPRMRRLVHKRRWRSAIGAIIVATGGWLAAGAVYIADLRADGRAIAAELSELEPSLRRIESLQRSVAAFAPVAEALRAESSGAGGLLSQVIDLARILPADTHLHALSVERKDGLTLEAHAPDALRFVAALEESWAGGVRLVGPPETEPALDGVETERVTVALEAPGA